MASQRSSGLKNSVKRATAKWVCCLEKKTQASRILDKKRWRSCIAKIVCYFHENIENAQKRSRWMDDSPPILNWWWKKSILHSTDGLSENWNKIESQRPALAEKYCEPCCYIDEHVKTCSVHQDWVNAFLKKQKRMSSWESPFQISFQDNCLSKIKGKNQVPLLRRQMSNYSVTYSSQAQ